MDGMDPFRRPKQMGDVELFFPTLGWLISGIHVGLSSPCPKRRIPGVLFVPLIPSGADHVFEIRQGGSRVAAGSPRCRRGPRGTSSRAFSAAF